MRTQRQARGPRVTGRGHSRGFLLWSSWAWPGLHSGGHHGLAFTVGGTTAREGLGSIKVWLFQVRRRPEFCAGPVPAGQPGGVHTRVTGSSPGLCGAGDFSSLGLLATERRVDGAHPSRPEHLSPACPTGLPPLCCGHAGATWLFCLRGNPLSPWKLSEFSLRNI